MANPDTQDTPKPPPNLRVSDDENRECDSCTHYQRGKCALYNNLPVDGEWVCDSYKQGGQDANDDQQTERAAKTPPAKNLREAEREAYVRVRAHNRRPASARQNSGQPEAADRVK